MKMRDCPSECGTVDTYALLFRRSCFEVGLSLVRRIEYINKVYYYYIIIFTVSHRVLRRSYQVGLNIIIAQYCVYK